MSEPKIPKGFVMIYTETHSICMRIDHIVSVAVACGSNHTLHITTRDGENYKAAYNFEEFLKIMAEEVEVVRWLESDGKAFCFESYARDHQATLTEGQIVKLTGTYRRRKPEPEAWEGKVSDIGIRRMEIMMDENAPAINGKRVRVELIEEVRVR